MVFAKFGKTLNEVPALLKIVNGIKKGKVPMRKNLRKKNQNFLGWIKTFFFFITLGSTFDLFQTVQKLTLSIPMIHYSNLE